jgi:hypothetical protein
MGSLKSAPSGLETTEAYEWYMSRALIRCPAGTLDLRAIGEEKRGIYSVPMQHIGW